MYGGYSYGKKHLGKVIPTNDRVIKIGDPPPHPTMFVGPVTVTELKKRMEVEQRKLENELLQTQQRNYLSELNRNEIKNESVNLPLHTFENKENVSSDETILIESHNSNTLHLPEFNSFNSKDSSNSSNQTYTLNNSDEQSPNHNLNSTYDKFEETENFNLQIDITQNVTSIHERKSVINKSNFRSYRQNRQDSMASDVHFNMNETDDISQFTDSLANANCTNKSVLLSFDNLKLDDECGNLTSVSMKSYKDSPVAKLLMDNKFSHDYASPLKNKSKLKTSARKSIPSNIEKHQNSPVTPKSNRKSASKNAAANKATTPKSSIRKSNSKNNEPNTPCTPKPTSARKSLFSSDKKTNSGTLNVSSVRAVSNTNHLKNPATTLRTGSLIKRKHSHLSEENLNVSEDRSPAIRRSLLLNKENISVRKTPGKMSGTLITELKAENCLINTSIRDSTGSFNNRSTPDVFDKMPNEMWKSTLNEVPENDLPKIPSATPFKSKLPQWKKTPNKYANIQSPVSKYIHRGEGIKSMSKDRHSSCIHELKPKSKSETKRELSESKHKPCKIPQRRANVQRKLDLPKINKNDASISKPSIVSTASSFRK